MVDWQGAALPHEKSPYNFTRKGLISYVVRLERFELPAYRFVACCSIQLSYSRATRGNLCKKGLDVKNFFTNKFILLCWSWKP